MTVHTSSHPITVDGIRLDTMAWNIQVKDGWDLSTHARGNNVEVPGRDGELWVPFKRDSIGRFVLSMWVNGTDSDGLPPASGTAYAQYRKNLDRLRLLFGSRHRLVHIVHNLGTAGTRECYAEVRQAWDPSMRRSPLGEFAVSFEIPAAFWQDTTDQNFDQSGVTSGAVYDALAFENATAPMRDLWVVVDGPITNPTLTDMESGGSCLLGFALPSGDQWVINTTEHSSKTGTGIAFTLGGTTRMLEIVRTGFHAPLLFGLTPRYAGSPQIRLTGTGLTGSTRLRVRGRRKYR